MNKTVEGRAFLFGANIDTDQIYPGRYLEITDPEAVGKHAMEGADPTLVSEFKPNDVIVAATNFGCGSSREHAAVALKAIGIGAVIAESFARIFYRNAINLGIPLLVCKGISEVVKRGDSVHIDFASGTIHNRTSGASMQAEAFSDYTSKILQEGGIKPLIKKEIMAEKSGV